MLSVAMLPHRVILMLIARDMLLEAQRKRKLPSIPAYQPQNRNMVAPQLPYKHILPCRCLNTWSVATTWAGSLIICEREKLLAKSFTSPLQIGEGAQAASIALPSQSFLYTHSYFLHTTRSHKQAVQVQITARRNGRVTHHKQTNQPDLTWFSSL